MKLLEKYILRRTFAMFMTALLPVLAIIWTTQVMQRIDLVTDTGQSIFSFMKLATLILPSIIVIVLPFALVIGITQTLMTMNNDSELTVMEAAGASRWVTIRPVLVLAIGLSLLSALLINVVEPKVRYAARDLIAEAYADLLSSVIEEKSFRRLEKDLYIQISERLQGRVLRGIFVADYRTPPSQLIYYAREGAVDPNGKSLVMRDGEVQQRNANGEVSVIRFDSYSFDLSSMTTSEGTPIYRSPERDFAFLLNPDPNDPVYKSNPTEFRAEFHRRLIEWCYPLLYALWALVAVAEAKSHRQTRISPMLSSLSTAAFLRLVAFYTIGQIEYHAIYIPIAYAVPIVFTLMAVFALWRRSRLQSSSALEGLYQRLSHRIELWREQRRALNGGKA